MKIKLFDGFMNVLKGIGGEKDVTTNTTYSSGVHLSNLWLVMNDLYSSNWIASKVVNIPIDDAFKNERVLKCEDAEVIDIFKKECYRLKLDDKISTALKWADVFGGSVIIINTSDDTLDKPLNIKNIKQGYLKSITVLDRWDIFPQRLQTMNPLRDDYLEPEYYTLSKGGGAIHRSRVIKFTGEMTTNYNKQLMQSFGISKFEKLYTSIMNATQSPDLLINLLVQSNLDVYGVEGLKDNLLDGDDDLLIKRFNMVNKAKSVLNGILIDKNDSYTNIAKNFSGLSEIDKRFLEVICGACDIPFSRFMGQSVTGLAQTNQGDLENYYNNVKSQQNRADTAYTILDKVIQMNLFGELKDIDYEHKSLFELDDLQKATIRKTEAETDNIYLTQGVIDGIDVKSRLAQSEQYPTITPESVEEEKALLKEYENFNEPLENETRI